MDTAGFLNILESCDFKHIAKQITSIVRNIFPIKKCQLNENHIQLLCNWLNQSCVCDIEYILCIHVLILVLIFYQMLYTRMDCADEASTETNLSGQVLSQTIDVLL